MLTREASEESVEPSNLKSGRTSRHTGQGREGVAAAGGRAARAAVPVRTLGSALQHRGSALHGLTLGIKRTATRPLSPLTSGDKENPC